MVVAISKAGLGTGAAFLSNVTWKTWKSWMQIWQELGHV